jgi:hypothetical protein
LEEFRKYEKEAKEKGRGLWKEKGLYEIEWLEKEGRKPFLVYEMSNNSWGIKYNGFVKLRLSSEELIKTLELLRVWVNEYSPKDLEEVLLKDGWIKRK